MEYRRLGRTELRVSAVAFGTCQLRLVPEREALATLRHGFDLGVNLVHTAPDYEGATELVARAVRESGRDVIVANQGYGSPAQVERQFESTCALLGTDRLALFGIACVDDRERLGENVFGPGGMVEVLERRKAEGRLGGLFCTTHGDPAYIEALLRRDVFDALMLAWNPLGFHLLSWHPHEPIVQEDLPRNRDLFALAAARDVGVMVMKPLAGGLLVPGKAFPERTRDAGPRLSAREVLRAILREPGVSTVVPGTASVTEAEENALAGHGPGDGRSGSTGRLTARVSALRTTLCSRCGHCDDLCSNGLAPSWLFRAAYLQLYPSETFEAVPEQEYFHLHPREAATCASCANITCRCPAGVDIPGALIALHRELIALHDEGILPRPEPAAQASAPVRIVRRDVPSKLVAGAVGTCRLYVENGDTCTWLPAGGPGAARLELRARRRLRPLGVAHLRDAVLPGGRGHFALEFAPPSPAGAHELSFVLVNPTRPALARRQTIGRFVVHVEDR
jgi:predicted aldo/keto reductase-like oxidoreductase